VSAEEAYLKAANKKNFELVVAVRTPPRSRLRSRQPKPRPPPRAGRESGMTIPASSGLLPGGQRLGAPRFLLRLVVEQKASDLHFHSGVVPLIRHDGDLVPLDFRALSETDARRFLLEILTPEQRTASIAIRSWTSSTNCPRRDVFGQPVPAGARHWIRVPHHPQPPADD